MNLPAEYPYNPRWTSLLWIPLFFGLCGAVSLHMAFRQRSLLADQLFFGSLGALAFLFVIASGVLVARRFFAPKVLRLEEEALVLPHGLFQKHSIRIAYAEIENLTQLDVYGTQFLEMIYRGRKYSITTALLPSAASFEEIKAFIASKRLPTGVNWQP
jgi:hypothetical protein